MSDLLAIDVATDLRHLGAEHAQWSPIQRGGLDRLFGAEAFSTVVSPEESIREMDEGGVEKAFVMAMTRRPARERGGVSYEQVAELVARYPNRLVGRLRLDPRSGAMGYWDIAEELRDMERAVKEFGFRSMFFTPGEVRRPPNDKVYYPFYAKCVELDLVVSIHIGHDGALRPSEMSRPIHLDEVALDFPDLKLIGFHIGWPWTDEMVALAVKFPNVYIDLTAHAPKHYPPEIVKYMRSRGQDKVLWGAFHPAIPWKRAREEFDQLNLKESVRRKILRDNAQKLFKF